jgi:hypothetical protein
MKNKKFSIAEIQKLVHQNAVDKGFWEGQDELTVDSIGMKLALIHSEVSEALEDVRVGKLKTYLAEKMGIDMEEEILLKHKFNTTRPHRHGGKLA